MCGYFHELPTQYYSASTSCQNVVYIDNRANTEAVQVMRAPQNANFFVFAEILSGNTLGLGSLNLCQRFAFMFKANQEIIEIWNTGCWFQMAHSRRADFVFSNGGFAVSNSVIQVGGGDDSRERD